MKSGRGTGPLVTGLLGAIAVIGLGVWGWGGFGSGDPVDAVYKSLQAFVLSESYSELETLQPGTRLPLEAARWIGAFFAFYAVILLLWSNLGVWRLTTGARGRRGHLVVVGDTVFANRLSETASGDALKLKSVQLRAPDQPPAGSGRLIRLPFHGFDRDGLDEAGTGRARRLVVALADDDAAVDLALAAQRRYPGLSILARLDNGGLLRSLNELPGGEALRVFSEAEAAAREAVRRHPLFLLAGDRRQTVIHALLIGDDDWVEALLTEIILSSRTLVFGKPGFTVCVADPETLRRRLSLRYPELHQEADLRFSAFDATTLYLDADVLAGSPPVTAAYCAFEDGARTLSAALTLKRQALSWAGFDAPILARVLGDQGLGRPAAGSALSGLGIVPFGSMTDIIHAAGILSETTDKAERDWHDAYLRLNINSGASVPWDQLSEDYRLSNRRAVAHSYAKLFEAGFDLRPWLGTANPWDELPALAPGEDLFRDEAELRRLAELEHERWNADRRLLGWRLGETKDEARKLHPCLTDFASLTAEIQGYDIKLIQNLNSILPRRKNGLRRS